MAEFRFKSTVDAMARKKRTEANRPAQINFRPSAELMRRLRFVSEALGIAFRSSGAFFVRAQALRDNHSREVR